MKIENLPLHDATLKSIEIFWTEGECIVRMATWEHPARALVFEGMIEVKISRKQPWGPSESINGVVERAEGVFEIEMQSGDTVCIVASNVLFDTDASAAGQLDR